jgi:hypothetical protein
VFVERKIGHEPFQPAVLFFCLPQLAEFAHAQMRVLLFLDVEGRVTDTELSAEIADRGPTLGLPDGINDLFFGES